MSLFKSIIGAAAPIVGGIFGGPAGAALGAAIGGAVARPKQVAAPLSLTGTLMPGVMPAMGALPPLVGGAIGGAVVAGGRVALMSARTIARSAVTYCRRHPAWCASIGGTAAIGAMIEAGQLPTIRRRRGRGITPRDLRSFRRVGSLIRGFCPTVRRIPARQLHVRRTAITHA